MLNDRLLLASKVESINVAHGVAGVGLEVRARLLGLLEPLLLGWVTQLQALGPDPSIQLSDLALQLTAR